MVPPGPAVSGWHALQLVVVAPAWLVSAGGMPWQLVHDWAPSIHDGLLFEPPGSLAPWHQVLVHPPAVNAGARPPVRASTPKLTSAGRAES
jgi:hypothetical protein